MKRPYQKPRMEIQSFTPNDFVAVCAQCIWQGLQDYNYGLPGADNNHDGHKHDQCIGQTIKLTWNGSSWSIASWDGGGTAKIMGLWYDTNGDGNPTGGYHGSGDNTNSTYNTITEANIIGNGLFWETDRENVYHQKYEYETAQDIFCGRVQHWGRITNVS